MKLAVSNIAWAPEEDAAAAQALKKAGADAIEVAPARLLGDPAKATPSDVQRHRDIWQNYGLPITSMQALLYGRPDLKLFAADKGDALVAYLSTIMDLAAGLGARPLVFGSPGNRSRGELDLNAAHERAERPFRLIGDLAAERGLIFCLEPNAPGYGCDFLTKLDEAADMVAALDHEGIGLIVDTGNMAMVGDTPETAARYAHLARHLHLSRPNLAPVDEGDDFPGQVLAALLDTGYSGDVTIEMRRSDTDPIGAIVRATTRAKAWMDGA